MFSSPAEREPAPQEHACIDTGAKVINRRFSSSIIQAAGGSYGDFPEGITRSDKSPEMLWEHFQLRNGLADLLQLVDMLH